MRILCARNSIIFESIWSGFHHRIESNNWVSKVYCNPILTAFIHCYLHAYCSANNCCHIQYYVVFEIERLVEFIDFKQSTELAFEDIIYCF